MTDAMIRIVIFGGIFFTALPLLACRLGVGSLAVERLKIIDLQTNLHCGGVPHIQRATDICSNSDDGRRRLRIGPPFSVSGM